MNALRRIINPVVRVVDEARGLVDYVASDETLDSYNEVVRADGWRFSHFAKNAPFVDSHQYDSIDKLLGKVVDFRVSGKKLHERVEWAIGVGNDLAELGFKMTMGGYLKAVSVGFRPVRMVTKFGDAGIFEGELRKLDLPADALPHVRTIYLEQEQLELSACVLGANPNALAKACRDGFLTSAEVETLRRSPSVSRGITSAATALERISRRSDEVRQLNREMLESIEHLERVFRRRLVSRRR